MVRRKKHEDNAGTFAAEAFTDLSDCVGDGVGGISASGEPGTRAGNVRVWGWGGLGGQGLQCSEAQTPLTPHCHHHRSGNHPASLQAIFTA